MGETGGADDWELSDTERRVLEALAEGRETRGSLAQRLDRDSDHMSRPLRTLRGLRLIEYHHEPTALYTLTERGRRAVEDASGE